MSFHEVFEPDWRVSPGETLRELLDDRNLSRADLVALAGLTDPVVDRILSGDEPITEEVAAALERATNVSARFWLNLEAAYRKPLPKEKR